MRPKLATFSLALVGALLVAVVIYDVGRLAAGIVAARRGGTRLEYKIDLSRIPRDPRSVSSDVRDLVAERLRSYGVSHAVVELAGDDRVDVWVPTTDSESLRQVREQVERLGVLRFHVVVDTEEDVERIDEYLSEEQRYLGAQLRYVRDVRDWRDRREAAQSAGREFLDPEPEAPPRPKRLVRFHKISGNGDDPPQERPLVLGNTDGLVVDGSQLAAAFATVDGSYRPAVGFELTSEGARRFGELTGAHVGSRLAIVLDDEVVSAPVIEERISRRGILRGGFTNEEVRGVVAILRAGSLPAGPVLESTSEVDSLPFRPTFSWSAYAILGCLAIIPLSMVVFRRRPSPERDE